MAFSFRSSTSNPAPRPTIRQRLHNAAVSIRERVSRRHRKGGGTDTARRALMAGSLASAAVVSFSVEAANDAAPMRGSRLAELMRQFEETYSLQQQTAAALDAAYAEFGYQVETPLNEEWADLHEAVADLAWEILKEPTRSTADLAAKLSVWDRCIWDKNDDSDDITDKSGWMDHASNRLLSDARLILGLARHSAA